MTLKTKVNSVVSYIEKGKRKTWRGRKRRCRRFWISFSRERVSSFSLSFCAIRPSAVFGTRRKAAILGEGFACRFKEFPQTSRGRGFSLLGFILCLRTMLMLELVEAVRGRLIGPKT